MIATPDITNETIISYRVMHHSMKLLSFFSHYTSPVYKFSNISFMREYLPILLFVQGLVYKADFEIEAAQKENIPFNDISPWTCGMNSIMEMLKHLNLYTPSAEKEAEKVSEYWQLENQMMRASEIDYFMLKKAIELRASDVLLLHHICQKISNVNLSNEVWNCIQLIEIIRDIEADLRQYESDVKSRDFNIYRMFVKVYGNESRQLLENELESRKTEYRRLIQNLPSNFNAIFIELTTRYYAERPPIRVPEIIDELKR